MMRWPERIYAVRRECKCKLCVGQTEHTRWPSAFTRGEENAQVWCWDSTHPPNTQHCKFAFPTPGRTTQKRSYFGRNDA